MADNGRPLARLRPSCAVEGGILRAIIVGAGGIGRAVLERLGAQWSVTAVDVDFDRLADLATRRPIEWVVGDGSSRIILRRAGLAGADAVVVALRDDDVALEVTRLATEAKVPRVVAMVVDSPRAAEFARLGATVVAPDRLAAREVELTIEPRRLATAGFADGQAEAIEFWLAPDSSLVGRTLAGVGLHGWLIAAVMREGRLIVPHGDTAFAAGDRVTVVGPTSDHSAMVRVFTEGEARFPLGFGRRIGVALGSGSDALVREAIVFAQLTAAEALVAVHPRRATLDGDAAHALDEQLATLAAEVPHLEFAEGSGEQPGLRDLVEMREREHFGCLVVPRARGLRNSLGILRRVADIGLPMLLAGGVPRYDKLVIPARQSGGAWGAAWVAFDLAGHNGLAVEALGASSPRFLVAEDDEPALRAAIMRLRDEGSIRGVEVTGRVVRANPIRLFQAIEPSALLVLSFGERPGGLLRPGFSASVAGRRSGSLLLVPPDPNRTR